ncbi:hypothetical protein OV203_20990 [Nannocystis sp. ILAH1]|uniref:hypothetical protein n=1 Tax=unclassified Nannocystis TaxID=2627009 RepID=UPI00226F203E|nr:MULTISPECIES: hypothetical protein [unclassified Nannocystis]MCY0989627.1 hypothetical protein [Nannocystis sp. ILAH1]MCY1071273.1 hypothetical protein [Nannocystis sp. RBIL2]
MQHGTSDAEAAEIVRLSMGAGGSAKATYDPRTPVEIAAAKQWPRTSAALAGR